MIWNPKLGAERQSPLQGGDLGEGPTLNLPPLHKKKRAETRFFVEMEGVEPSSKQGTQMLSTRLSVT